MTLAAHPGVAPRRRPARRPARRAGAGLAATVVGILALAGPGAPPTGAAPDEGSTPSGSASAAGLFITYQDNFTVIPGGTAAPPDLDAPFASASIDGAGIGNAIGALAYTPYLALPGAVNGLAPPGVPKVPLEGVLGAAAAVVDGQPPKEVDASASPPLAPAVSGGRLNGFGTMHAKLAEGPVAEATAHAARVAPTAIALAATAASYARVDQRTGVADGRAESVIEGIDIGGVVRISALELVANAAADGEDGVGAASVVLKGVSIAGIPLAIGPDGIDVAGQQTVPLALQPVVEALAAQGIELRLPARRTVETAGDRAVAEATGPELLFHGPNDEEAVVTLGKVSVGSSLVAPGGGAGAVDVDGTGTGTGADGTGATTGSVTEPSVDVPSFGTGGSDLGGPDLGGSDLGGGGASGAPEVALPTPGAGGGGGQVSLARTALTGERDTDRFSVLYGALAIASLLLVVGVAVPRGSAWERERERL